MLLALILVAVLPGFADAAIPQNLRELARRHAVCDPGMPLEQPAPPAEYPPKPIEQLAREADLVLLGRLTRNRSYLGPQEDRVLTDYRILEPTVIAGRVTSSTKRIPGPALPLILTVYGGEVTVEGVRVRATDNNREVIKDGGEYLLFLRESRVREADRYEIHNGAIFEILDQQVTPLLKGAENVFQGTLESRLDHLLLRIVGLNKRQ